MRPVSTEIRAAHTEERPAIAHMIDAAFDSESYGPGLDSPCQYVGHSDMDPHDRPENTRVLLVDGEPASVVHVAEREAYASGDTVPFGYIRDGRHASPTPAQGLRQSRPPGCGTAHAERGPLLRGDARSLPVLLWFAGLALVWGEAACVAASARCLLRFRAVKRPVGPTRNAARYPLALRRVWAPVLPFLRSGRQVCQLLASVVTGV
jgi:hypothetical protein